MTQYVDLLFKSSHKLYLFKLVGLLFNPSKLQMQKCVFFYSSPMALPAQEDTCKQTKHRQHQFKDILKKRKYNQIQKHCRKHRRPEKPCPGDTTFQRLETVSIVVCATWSHFLTLHLHSLSICSYILMFCMYYSFLCSLDPYRNSISARLII